MPWAPEIRTRIARTLVEAAGRHPEWHVVLRAHPSEPPLDFELPDYVGVWMPRTQPARQALRAADVSVTVMSTMGLEAVMLGNTMVTTHIVPEQRPKLLDLDYEDFLRNMQFAEVAQDSRIEPAIERALRQRPDRRHRLPSVGGAHGRRNCATCELRRCVRAHSCAENW